LDKAFYVFTFFDMTLQKNVKSRFLDFEKNVKNVFSNNGPQKTRQNGQLLNQGEATTESGGTCPCPNVEPPLVVCLRCFVAVTTLAYLIFRPRIEVRRDDRVADATVLDHYAITSTTRQKLFSVL